MVLLRQVWTEHQHARQVDLASSNFLQHDWESTRDSCRAGATKCGVFGHPKFIDTICINAGTAAQAVDAACIDLAEVGEERSQQLIRTTDQAAHAAEQVFVGKLGKSSEVVGCTFSVQCCHG
jgi:hypothetical protein